MTFDLSSCITVNFPRAAHCSWTCFIVHVQSWHGWYGQWQDLSEATAVFRKVLVLEGFAVSILWTCYSILCFGFSCSVNVVYVPRRQIDRLQRVWSTWCWWQDSEYKEDDAANKWNKHVRFRQELWRMRTWNESWLSSCRSFYVVGPAFKEINNGGYQ